MKLNIKKGAKVKVIAGAEKGKEGQVLQVDRKRLRVLVQGVSIRTHFDKKDGIQKKEGFINYSNVKLLEQAQEKKATGKKKSASKKA